MDRCIGPTEVVYATRTSSDGGLYLVIELDSTEVCCLVDSGSSLSVVHPSVYRNIDRTHRPRMREYKGQIRVADGGHNGCWWSGTT